MLLWISLDVRYKAVPLTHTLTSFLEAGKVIAKINYGNDTLP